MGEKRKKFHCGDLYCRICNTEKEVHKYQVEYQRRMQKKWAAEARIREEIEAEKDYRGFWRRLADAIF